MNAMLVGAIASGAAIAALVLVPLAPELSLPRLGHPDAAALEDARWTRGPRGWIAVQTTALGLAAAVCVAAGWPLVFAAAAAVAPSVWMRLRAEAARERAKRALGPIVTAAGAALRSGMSLPEALRRAADASADEVAARPIRDALQAFDLGASLDGALTVAAAAARDERARTALATLALGIGERLPRDRAADLLDAVGERIGFEDRLAEEVRARAAGARQQQRLLAAIVPLLALYLVATMPMLAATLGSDLGRFVLIPAAAILEIGGVVLGRRIVRGALD